MEEEQNSIRQDAPPIGGIKLTRKQIAEVSGCSLRSMERAIFVERNGIPDLNDHVTAGRLKIHRAEQIARLPRSEQRAALSAALDAPPRKREPWSLQQDADKLADMVNHMARRWTKDNRRAVALMLKEWAHRLVEGGDAAEGSQP